MTAVWLTAVLLAACGAQAQDARVPSTEEIIRRLTPGLQPAPVDLRSHAISVEGRRAPPVVAGGAAASIDLHVNFEYASAKLTPDARLVLDNLGRALLDDSLREARFRIAGHTDARGSDTYNLNLSRLRARSVADYLAREHGVTSVRLAIEGHGRSRLLDTANPESAVNRRVEITNLGK